MGWITLAEARTGAGTDASTSAAAASIAAWLEEMNACVTVSQSHPKTDVYSRNGISLQQEQDITVREYKGLAQDLADFLAQYLRENNTRRWMMYGIDQANDIHEVGVTYGPASSSASIGMVYWIGGAGTYKNFSQTAIRAALGGDYYPPTSGRSVVAEAQRANASDGWMVRATTTVYMAPTSLNSASRQENKAFLPIPPPEAWDGVIVSQSKQKTYLATSGNIKTYQSVETKVTEYRYLSLAQANAKVVSECAQNSKTYDIKIPVSWSTGGTTEYKNITVRGGGSDGSTAATDKTATSRQQGHGLYTVTVTEMTYQATTS